MCVLLCSPAMNLKTPLKIPANASKLIFLTPRRANRSASPSLRQSLAIKKMREALNSTTREAGIHKILYNWPNKTQARY